MSGRAVDREVPNTSLSLSVSSLSQNSRISESVVSAVDSLTFHPEPDAAAPAAGSAHSNDLDMMQSITDLLPNYIKPPEIEYPTRGIGHGHDEHTTPGHFGVGIGRALPAFNCS